MGDGVPKDAVARAPLWNLANLLTFARFCAVPVALRSVFEQRFDHAFIVLVAAGLSDALDGWFARRFGGNLVGAIMDPLADKALLVTMYISLAALKVIPDWLAVLVVTRDIIIVGGVVMVVLMGSQLVIRPIMLSKVNTAAQFALVAISLLRHGFDIGSDELCIALVWCVAATTVASGAAYVRNTFRGD